MDNLFMVFYFKP